MQRVIFLLILLFLCIHSEIIQQTKRKVNPKKIQENVNKDDEVDDESGVFSTYADNRYAPSDSLTTTITTTGSTNTRTRWTTPASVLIREDTDDHLEHARFMAASSPSCYSVVDMNHPLLADTCGVLPQARYTLPNLFGHRERWQIELFLHGLISATTDTTCLRSLRLLLCPLLFPPCPSRIDMATTPTSTLFPCQSFCRAVKTHCSIPALDFLPCETLPLSSDLCPTNQVYGAFFSQIGIPTPSIRSKSSRPLPIPMQDAASVSSWNQQNTGHYIHQIQEPPMSISTPMGIRRTFFSE